MIDDFEPAFSGKYGDGLHELYFRTLPAAGAYPSRPQVK